MRLYLAAPFNRKVETLMLRDELIANFPKTEITSRWLTNGFVDDNVSSEVMVEEAINDVQDIEGCEMFVLFNFTNWKSTSGAMFVEFGLAWALGKFIILVGEKTQIFHYHPAVHWFPTLDKFMEYLRLEHRRA